MCFAGGQTSAQSAANVAPLAVYGTYSVASGNYPHEVLTVDHGDATTVSFTVANPSGSVRKTTVLVDGDVDSNLKNNVAPRRILL
jgi:VCBS repeat-containing protein